VSGRLGLGELDQRLQTLARAPAPRDRAASDALAARQDVDRAALWWVVVEGEHARATGARRHSGVRPASRARSARPGLKADR
jgi:hypothetical protein